MKKNMIKAINMFYKEATLLGDVANRAMYSMIPGGEFNFIAAKWVVSGAIDVIYYGTKEVIDELKYCKGSKDRDKEN